MKPTRFVTPVPAAAITAPATVIGEPATAITATAIVIPAKAGIQRSPRPAKTDALDSRLRGNDGDRG